MQTNLYITNLGYSVTDDSLRNHFESCGHVTSAQVILERDTGRSRGFGFVEMGSESAAQEAIQKLHDQPLDGRSLGVAFARARK